MKQLAFALVSSLALAGSAFAAGTKTPSTAPTQTHHCVGKDGTPQPGLTHKQCSKAGGAWKKDTAPATGAPAAKPAEPAPKAAEPAPKAPEPAPKAPAPAPAAPATPPAK
jgi:hypothetical protein